MSASCFMKLGHATPLQPHTTVDFYLCPFCHTPIFEGGQFYVRGQLRGHKGVYAEEPF